MKSDLSESERLMIGKWIEDLNYAELEKWIANDPDRAKEIFSQHRSFNAVKEIDMVFHPPALEREELASRNASEIQKSKGTIGAEIKRIVIAFTKEMVKELKREGEKRLSLLVGGSYQRLPEPGLVRSSGGGNSLDFGGFSIWASSANDPQFEASDYELRLTSCIRVTVDKIEGGQPKRIYEGNNISGFKLTLGVGIYRIVHVAKSEEEVWEVELK